MTLNMWYTLIILAVAIILFVTEWIRLDIVAMMVVVALMLTRVLSPAEALAGFSNTAVITIAALFVVGGAVMQTGLAGAIGQRILLVAGQSRNRLTAVIMGVVAFISGFMSNTGTVAVLLPAIVSLGRSVKISPAKLLIPMAFAASLGGAATLIGTPPNLIVFNTLREAGFEPFGFFSFTPIGLILIVVGIIYMLFFGQILLPENEPKQKVQRIDTPDALIDLYRLPDNLFRLRIRRNSVLAGMGVYSSGLASKYHLDILELLRPVKPQSVVKFGSQRLVIESDQIEKIIPGTNTRLEIDDVLIVKGEGNDVNHAAAALNLAMQPVGVEDRESLITDEIGLAEVVLPPRSSLIGKTISELRFGTIYHLTVLGIVRPGSQAVIDLKNTPLEFGDTLLVQGPWGNILNLRENSQDFIVMGQPEAMLGAPQKHKAPIAFFVMAAMLILIVSGVVSVTTASMLAALAVVLTGCLTMDEAYEAVDWKSIVLIAGMLPMSTALEKVELVNLVANWLTISLGGFGPVGIMAGLFFVTAIFTQVLSNTATTVLIAPIALVAAQHIGIRPEAFLMAVALAASQAFASPVASPVNTLVMGAGNYGFSDYMKVGVPLIIINLIVCIVVLPFLFPLS